jgi:hypothetical protein
MSFGQGMALSYSWKQKINTKSSTEAELVGVDDSLGYILWARYFMIEQGYDMDPSLLYQDNMSAILLETNRRASSSKRTKHIKVKYFLIKDKVDQEEITIEHCPTEQMWTDINTKPKQGAVFRAFRGHVMGIPTDYNNTSFATMCNFRPSTWVPKPVSMLPITRNRVAAKECVEERVTNKEVGLGSESPTKDRQEVGLGSESPTKDRRVRFAIDMPPQNQPNNQPNRINVHQSKWWADVRGARGSTSL